MDNYLTTKQASEKLGVAPRTVQDWCKIQKIPGVVKSGWYQNTKKHKEANRQKNIHS